MESTSAAAPAPARASGLQVPGCRGRWAGLPGPLGAGREAKSVGCSPAPRDPRAPGVLLRGQLRTAVVPPLGGQSLRGRGPAGVSALGSFGPRCVSPLAPPASSPRAKNFRNPGRSNARRCDHGVQGASVPRARLRPHRLGTEREVQAGPGPAVSRERGEEDAGAQLSALHTGTHTCTRTGMHKRAHTPVPPVHTQRSSLHACDAHVHTCARTAMDERAHTCARVHAHIRARSHLCTH